MATILITGGTGLIGKQLTQLLQKKGHKVTILSRTKSNKKNFFQWNIATNFIEEKAITTADYIIHLAGANIGAKRWTTKRKEQIIDSRVNPTLLLHKKIQELNPNLKAFIAASGIGYYGAITSHTIFKEDDNPHNDFLSKVCQLWEKASLQFQTSKIRTVIFRTGVVYSKKGGAFSKIISPIKKGFGAALGNGKQYMPWIHINDLCKMYLLAIENKELQGIYNAVSPEYITNKQLTKCVAQKLNKKVWLPNVPAFVLKLALGEMADLILYGSRVSVNKIKNIGFTFQFKNINKSLNS